MVGTETMAVMANTGQDTNIQGKIQHFFREQNTMVYSDQGE